MAISFELPEKVTNELAMAKALVDMYVRPYSREMDEEEHKRPTEYIKVMWPVLRDRQARSMEKRANGDRTTQSDGSRPSIEFLRIGLFIEMLSWGDVGLYLCMPYGGLALTAIEAAGTDEQKERFLRRFAEGDEPVWGGMAMTEPGAGSDTSSIKTSAVLDEETNEWVINGEKIFCTSGGLALNESNGVVVVWATIDRTAGRAGMRPFVVEAGTPGVTVTKAELKHGIRASDTVSIVLDNARIPFDNLLGSPEIEDRRSTMGFKNAMATFDASRPMVAVSTIGVGRAAVEFVKEVLEKEGIEIRYNAPRHIMTALERDVIEMEAQHKAAYLLTLRSISMLDHGEGNRLEASICKAKAGKASTWIAQKAVEILGPMGYSREWLAEKWMRDAKIGDIYEGTQQINLLIIARAILGYSSKDLN
jgi:acyl-CoA dehydrogenase